MERTILHVDLNNFFASVECKYAPELKDKFMAVSGSASDRRGVVLAKNQNAKNVGVKTGMTLLEAKKVCPEIIFVEANHSRYETWSRKAKEIFARYSDKIESFGIDEAWIDVTNSKIFGSGEKIANEIRQAVKTELDLTVSVGVSFNKVFAKLASDMKKPDATTVITVENFKQKVWKLPVEYLLFVGKQTLVKLKKIGINTIGDLALSEFGYISSYLGKLGENLWIYANGKDDSPVAELGNEREIKSVGNSVTCYRDLAIFEDVAVMLTSLCESVAERVLRYDVGRATTLTLSVRDSELHWFSRQGKLRRASVLADDYYEKAVELFKNNYRWERPIRSLGVSVSDFTKEEQLALVDDDYEKKLNLFKTVNGIRDKYGQDGVLKGIALKDKRLAKSHENSDK